jgi:hypothetical protein
MKKGELYTLRPVCFERPTNMNKCTQTNNFISLPHIFEEDFKVAIARANIN